MGHLSFANNFHHRLHTDQTPFRVMEEPADRVAQLIAHRTSVREFVGSSPDRANLQGL